MQSFSEMMAVKTAWSPKSWVQVAVRAPQGEFGSFQRLSVVRYCDVCIPPVIHVVLGRSSAKKNVATRLGNFFFVI